MANIVISEGNNYDITIKKGATFRQNFISAESADSDGNPVNPDDLSGYTARMQIRRTFGSEVIVELTTENGGITITALTGNIDLLISATATALYREIRGVYDLELINGTEVVRFVQGNATITENVTR